MVVARVRLNRLDAHAYGQCFRATFDQVTEDHPTFQPGTTLTGIIADWSEQQITGLEMVLGKPTASSILKGCQVHIMMHFNMLLNIIYDRSTSPDLYNRLQRSYMAKAKKIENCLLTLLTKF